MKRIMFVLFGVFIIVAGVLMMIFNGANLSPFFLPLDVFVTIALYLLIVLSVMNFFFRDLEVRHNVRDSQKHLMARNSQRTALVIVIICVFMGIIVATPFIAASANKILSKEGSETLDQTQNLQYAMSFENQDRLALFKSSTLNLEWESGRIRIQVCEEAEYKADDACTNPIFDDTLSSLNTRVTFSVPQSGYRQLVMLATNTGPSSSSFNYHLETNPSPAFVGLQPLIVCLIFITVNSIWIGYLQPIKKRFATSSIYSEDYLVEVPAEAETTEREVPVAGIPSKRVEPTPRKARARLAPRVKEEAVPPPPPLPGSAHPLPKGAFLRELILLLNAEGDRKQTEDLLRTLIELEPMNKEALLRLGNLFHEDGKYDLAFNQYDRVTKIDSRNEEAWIRRGDVLLSLNKDFQAIQSFREALRVDPDNPEATEWIRRLRRENQSFMAKAIDRSAKSDFKGAIELYDLILARDPDNIQALLGKGTMYRRLEKWPASLESLNRVLDLDPGNAAALHNKAEVFESAMRWEDALLCYNKIVEANPDNYLDWVRRGDVLSELNDPEGALESYRRARELKPDSERVMKRIDLLVAPAMDEVVEEFMKLPKIGKSKAIALFEAGFQSIEDLEKAGVKRISRVRGISKKMARAIKEHLRE